MGFFERFVSIDTDDNETTQHDVSKGEQASVAPGTSDEYAVDFSEMECHEKRGKELKCIDSETGDVYAGEWPRRLIEGARENNEQAIWFGYSEPDPLQGPKEVGIDFDHLFLHTALFGSTGHGKSTVLKNTMVQWAFGGYGFCFIDPKGDDSKDLIQSLPDDRLDDVLWVEPAPEDFEKVVGINFLDMSKEYGEEGFESEAKQIIQDIIPILRDEGTWGPRMNEVVRGFLRAMLYLSAMDGGQDYTLVDLYKLLTEKELRIKFAEKVERKLGHDEDILQNAVEKFAEIDDQDLASARRRLQEWVIDGETKQVVAHTDSSVNLTEAVQEGKIVIVRTASISDDKVKRGVATAVIRRIWTAIQMRESIPEHEREPYFLCMDEFDDIATGESDMGRILSKGRSYRIGTVLANQQPHQLSKEIQDGVLGNCNNLLAMNPRHPDDARVISKVFDDDSGDILNLGRFQIATQIEVGGEPSPVFLTHTFPEYPPRRTRDEAQQIVQEIVDEHGVPPVKAGEDVDTDQTKFDPEADDGASDEQTLVVSDNDDTMTMTELLSAIYTAQIRAGGAGEWVSEEEIGEEVERRVGAATYNKVGNAIAEKLPDTYVEKQLQGGDLRARLKERGEVRAFSHADTGQSASAGGAGHRVLIQLAHEAFTKLGYTVDVPKQVGGDQPDAIAKPPINPAAEAESAREMQELIAEFEEEYPHIADIFEYDELHIEPEKATVDSKPKQLMKNLSKALEVGRDCVFVVPDGEGEHGELGYYANRALTALRNPPYCRRFIERQDFANDDRHFYNKNQKVKIPNRGQMFAAKKDDGHDSVWREDDDTIILENPEDGDPLVEFDSWEDFDDCEPSDFPYTYHYDNQQQEVIVTDRRGNKVDSFTGDAERGPVDVMFDNGYSKIPEPLIPEREFPDGEIPSEDRWHIVVIPDSDKDIGPRYYEKDKDELRPLLPEDEVLSADLDPSQEDPVELPDDDPGAEFDEESPPETDETEDEEPDITPGEDAVDDSDVPVADPENEPKSTTDVVKESGEEWTKPEPGDDDYNPAKDNSNYRTGYDEDYTEADFTGGMARELDKEGDFEDYEPPESTDSDSDGRDESETDSIDEAITQGVLENDGQPPEVRDERDESVSEQGDETHDSTQTGLDDPRLDEDQIETARRELDGDGDEDEEESSSADEPTIRDKILDKDGSNEDEDDEDTTAGDE